LRIADAGGGPPPASAHIRRSSLFFPETFDVAITDFKAKATPARQ
jgi:hypothetical protein